MVSRVCKAGAEGVEAMAGVLWQCLNVAISGTKYYLKNNPYSAD